MQRETDTPCLRTAGERVAEIGLLERGAAASLAISFSCRHVLLHTAASFREAADADVVDVSGSSRWNGELQTLAVECAR